MTVLADAELRVTSQTVRPEPVEGLPTGWDRVPLEDVATIVRGVTYKKEQAIGEMREGFTPLLRATNITGSSITFDDLVFVPSQCVSEGQRLIHGDVVIASSSGSKEIVGKAGQFLGQHWLGSFGAFCTGIRPASSASPEFLGYYFQSPHYRSVVSALSAGSSINNLKSSELSAHFVPVAPRGEQTRIVEKLEELLSDLDAGVAELKAAQKKLTQYRQSLLKAAVEGALTAEWRKHNQPTESGAQLLERILKERRARWQAKQLAKFKEQGKAPPKDWQEKYPEPVKPDTPDLPPLPDGWVWGSLDEILSELRSGTAETSSRDATSYPVLKSSAVRNGEINFEALNFLRADQSLRSENFLALGDVLITRLSGSVEYVGCCSVVNNLPTLKIQYPDRIFCGKLPASMMWLSDYLVYCFRSHYVRRRLEAAAKSTAGHKRISLTDLHPLPFPLPPTLELVEVCRLISEGLQQIKVAEHTVEKSLKQSTAQRKNILKAAFSGQLVPQDLNDEPASALLARIRADRAGLALIKTVKKRGPAPIVDNFGLLHLNPERA